MALYAHGIVKDKKEADEKIGDSTTHRYYLYVRFSDPQKNNKTVTEQITCSSETQYRGYDRGDDINLRLETDNFLFIPGSWIHSWQVDD